MFLKLPITIIGIGINYLYLEKITIKFFFYNNPKVKDAQITNLTFESRNEEAKFLKSKNLFNGKSSGMLALLGVY